MARQIETNCGHGIQLHPDIVHIFLLLFADDIVLFSSTINGLQNQIYELENYCDKWKLTVNREKTKIVVFKNGGKSSKKEIWFYKDMKLECIGFYKYLGLYFTSGLSWAKHVKYAALQGQKALIGIMKQLSVIGNLNYISFFKIFYTNVSPILSYAAELLGIITF